MSVVGNASATPDLKVLKGKIKSLSPYAVDKTLSVNGASADAKMTGDELAKRVKTSDIADNLTTDSADKVLSAKQGKALKNAVNTAQAAAESAHGVASNAVDCANDALRKANNAETAATNAQAAAEEAMNALTGGEGSVEERLKNAILNTGGKMTGALEVIAPTQPSHAVNKEYVDNLRKIVTATLYASQWVESVAPFTQTINVEGVTADADSAPHICLVLSDDPETAYDQMDAFACVSKGVTGNGTIRFTCFEEKPEIDITLQIEVHG